MSFFFLSIVLFFGIGTETEVYIGWSTSIPNYNPEEIVENLRRMMKGEDVVPMSPWYRGFKGEIRKTGDNKYDVFGCVRKINETTVEITELPIHKWTQTYKGELEAMIGEKGDGVIKVCCTLSTLNSSSRVDADLIALWYVGLQRAPRQHERPLRHQHVRERPREGRGAGPHGVLQADRQDQHEQHDVLRL